MTIGLGEAARRLAAGPATIAYLGASVTVQKDGYRPHLQAGLTRRFGHPHREINAGFGGVGAIASVCMMDAWVVAHRPALCFIECMTGDIGVGLQPDTGPALEGILHKLAAIDCAPCFLNLPRRGEDFSAANPAVRLYARLAAHHGVAAIDLGPTLSGEGADYFRDAVHTTPAGGVRTAELILEALEPRFAAATVAPGPKPGLFERDFSRAAIEPAALDTVRGAGERRPGRFRLVYPFIEFGPDAEMVFQSPSRELLGLLVIVGLHSGPTLINGETHQLRDRHRYDRLRGYVLPRPAPPGRPVIIAPLNEGAEAAPRVKLGGFMTRPA